MLSDPLVRELWRQIVWPEGKGLCVTDKNPIICLVTEKNPASCVTEKKLSVVVQPLSHKRLCCCEMSFERKVIIRVWYVSNPPFSFLCVAGRIMLKGDNITLLQSVSN